MTLAQEIAKCIHDLKQMKLDLKMIRLMSK